MSGDNFLSEFRCYFVGIAADRLLYFSSSAKWPLQKWPHKKSVCTHLLIIYDHKSSTVRFISESSLNVEKSMIVGCKFKSQGRHTSLAC